MGQGRNHKENSKHFELNNNKNITLKCVGCN